MNQIRISDLADKSQDYLKSIWDINEKNSQKTVSVSEIAEKLGQKVPTASEAIKRLAARGLVFHEKYAGVSLTETGREIALEMVRRHRLIEALLHDILGYSWDEVHEDADLLEHASSDRFINRVDAYLGYPTRDPHGDPIPTADGTVDDLPSLTLRQVKPGEELVVTRVDDTDSELLRYLGANSVAPGKVITIVGEPFAGMVTIEVQTSGESFPLPQSHLDAINVEQLK